MNDEEAQKVYEMFCTAKKGSIEESNWIHNMMPKGYTHGMALKNIRTRLEGLGYMTKRDRSALEKSEAMKCIDETADIKPVVSEKKANKMYSLDIATFGIMKDEKILGENVELALAEYVKKEHDVIAERKALPLEKLKRNVNLTMSVSFFRLLKKLAAGRRVESAIIEVALWQYYGGKK